MTNDDLLSIAQGILDEPTGDDGPHDGTPDWKAVCVCGHLEEHHSTSVGGSHPETSLGAPVDFDGCTGAMRSTGRRKSARVDGYIIDRQEVVVGDGGRRTVVPVTCTCREFRRVASIDRPSGRFRQRQGTTHPWTSGLKGMVKQWTRMAEKRGIPVGEMIGHRMRWEADLVCERCMSTEGVLPGYTVPRRESGLLCPECRDKARATLVL